MQTPKEDFLSKIINIYCGNMTNSARKEYYKACFEVLQGDINYRKLWQEFLYEFDTKTIGNAPSPQWLYKASLNCIVKPEKPKEELPPGVPCPPEIRQQLKAFFGKENPLSFDKI